MRNIKICYKGFAACSVAIFRTILSNCKIHLPYNKGEHGEHSMKELTEIMENCELSGRDFAHLGIRFVGGEGSEDSLLVYRKRGSNLTNH